MDGERERDGRREGGRDTLLGDGAYILNFNKITGEERVSEGERERGTARKQSATCSLAEWRKGANCARSASRRVGGWLMRSCSIPRTLPRTLRIDQALCRRKCPADGWTGGLWRKQRRRGEQRERKKSAGLLKTVSSVSTCLMSDPELSVTVKVKTLRRVFALHVPLRAPLRCGGWDAAGRCARL